MAGKSLAITPENSREALHELAMAIPEAVGDDDAGASIIARILSTMTAEQVLTPASAPSLGDKEGAIYTIHNLRRIEGGQNLELGFYLLVDATDKETGERAVYSTGAGNVVAQLVQLHKLDKLPSDVKVVWVESKRNPGRIVHWLVTPDHF